MVIIICPTPAGKRASESVGSFTTTVLLSTLQAVCVWERKEVEVKWKEIEVSFLFFFFHLHLYVSFIQCNCFIHVYKLVQYIFTFFFTWYPFLLSNQHHTSALTFSFLLSLSLDSPRLLHFLLLFFLVNGINLVNGSAESLQSMWIRVANHLHSDHSQMSSTLTECEWVKWSTSYTWIGERRENMWMSHTLHSWSK